MTDAAFRFWGDRSLKPDPQAWYRMTLRRFAAGVMPREIDVLHSVSLSAKVFIFIRRCEEARANDV